MTPDGEKASEWTEVGISEWGTSVFFAPAGTDPGAVPESNLYVPPSWTKEDRS